MNPYEQTAGMSGRQQRRLLARAQRIAARQPKAQPGRVRHTVGPVHRATVRQRLELEITALVTRAGVHSYLGEDTRTLADSFGRVVWVVCHAATAAGLADTPEARVLAGSAHALADIVALPSSLEQHRPAIISGLQAAQRLLPQLSTWALADAAQELDEMLVDGSLGTDAVDGLLRRGAGGAT